MSKKIWEIYLKAYHLKNVIVEVSTEASPITAMFKYVDDNLSDVNVIFGVSKKGGDEERFKSATKYYEDNTHINLIDPIETAVEPFTAKDGKAISATDIRDNVDKPDVIKKLLPSKLGKSELAKVIDILSSGPKESIEEDEASDDTEDSRDNLDEFEYIHLQINDELLQSSKIKCYNTNQSVLDDNGKEVPVNPKKFPDKAVCITVPIDNLTLEIFLDTETKKWDSNIKYRGINGKLSPEQFGQFFNTKFYNKLRNHLSREWPLSDEMYGQLFSGIVNKEMSCGRVQMANEDGEFEKHNINKDKNKNKDDEKPKYTNSGRKIVSFSDFGVKSSTFKGYCWPKEGKEFNWSTWADWKKIKPICRMSFKHDSYNYGVSISTYDENYENRGFRGYNLDIEPPLAWITPDECSQVMELSLFRKFARHCVKRITKYINMPTDEIMAKINNKDRCSKKDIEKTKMIIRKVLKYAIKPCKADTFSWK